MTLLRIILFLTLPCYCFSQMWTHNPVQYADKNFELRCATIFRAYHSNGIQLQTKGKSMDDYEIQISQGEKSDFIKDSTNYWIELYGLEEGEVNISIFKRNNQTLIRRITIPVKFVNIYAPDPNGQVKIGSYSNGCIPLSYLQKIRQFSIPKNLRLKRLTIYFAGTGFDGGRVFNVNSIQFENSLIEFIQEIGKDAVFTLADIEVYDSIKKVKLGLLPVTFQTE